MLRKSLELVALAALVALWIISWNALLGSSRLPDRIPIHFDLAGHADRWGGPQVMWLLPVFGTLLYAIMTIVARFPGAFNYPVRVTPANRPVLEDLAVRMITWLKAEVMCLFVWILYETLEAARMGQGAIPLSSILLVVVMVIATTGWYVMAMRRAAGTRLR